IYVEHFTSGVEQAREGIYPRVVWLVPGDHRKAQLADVLGSLPPEHWRLFAVASLGQAVDSLTGRSPPWQATA
ncbi:MAG: hypothetical protein M3021_13195, partial [Actinomycetota bacterium]|nr:hypothetical protein [Actinomycetota bacterium]